ncbi:MAG: hypothetical protein ORN26_01315 [Candidatus Pacebacteria bacterium]|nr:hypothetical protein [Candidatus Paceibacterota bacterium]
MYQSIIDFRNKEIESGEYKGQKRIDVYNKLINDTDTIRQILNTGKDKSIHKTQDIIREIRKIIGSEI